MSAWVCVVVGVGVSVCVRSSEPPCVHARVCVSLCPYVCECKCAWACVCVCLCMRVDCLCVCVYDLVRVCSY